MQATRHRKPSNTEFLSVPLSVAQVEILLRQYRIGKGERDNGWTPEDALDYEGAICNLGLALDGYLKEKRGHND